MNTKYVFVTGGVVSGLGKGITAASLGRLLKNRGYKVTIQKFDPYLNVDPGTMSPYEHGEVFVTDDGAETDLDLGHYERFIDENLPQNSSVTKENLYSTVIQNQRSGEYIHVTLLPYIFGSNEIKSKPTQHSVKELQSLGIQPDILVCRTEQDIPETVREKLALFCNVRKSSVIQNKTADNLYAVPLMLEEEGLAREVCNHMRLDRYVPDNSEWQNMIDNVRSIGDEFVNIAIVGKYVKLEDSYLSVIESLHHAGFANKVKVNIKLIDCETINEETASEKLKDLQGIIVPGGFGNRGIEGKIETIKYARENNIPFLGICLGMQMAVVEFARDVLGLKDANSAEFSESTTNPVIHIMDDQIGVDKKGGTMRLGAYPCILKDGTLAKELYGTEKISERHRHRYEYNNEYKERLEKAGLICSGTSPDGKLVEIVEYRKHPYFIAGQFHPELKSRPNRPAPLFVGLVRAAKEC